MKPTIYEGKKSRLNYLELEIVALMVEGMKTRQIADSMGTTEREVGRHTVNIFNKLGVCDHLELVLYVVANGIRPAPDLIVERPRSQEGPGQAASWVVTSQLGGNGAGGKK